MIDKKIQLRKRYKEKITIKRIRTKIDIKIKLYQILRNELKIIIKKKFKTKYTVIKRYMIKFNITNK
jgi:hypothetical protein